MLKYLNCSDLKTCRCAVYLDAKYGFKYLGQEYKYVNLKCKYLLLISHSVHYFENAYEIYSTHVCILNCGYLLKSVNFKNRIHSTCA